jgi:predicted AAA+ superfamily ATPase
VKITRAIEARLRKALKPNKVVLLLGARRTGKTWFLKNLLPKLEMPYLYLNGDDTSVQAIFKERTVANYARLIGDYKLLVIDEAHRIPEIGWNLKLMVDELEGLHIIATGSSVFDLRAGTGEPLTGRRTELLLHPFAQIEYSTQESLVETQSRLEERMIYGNYPELIHLSSNDEKEDYLREMVASYLLKDILEFEGIRNSSKVSDLLRLIAFQPGKEVSNDELSRALGISKNTVDRYLDLLQKVFVLVKVPGFSRNLRKEVTRHSRYYFVDNGVRNALINNFNPLSMRADTGELWENYVILQRLKYQSIKNVASANYFWRTYQQQEIDWVEDRGGKLYAYEIKWKDSNKTKVPSAWKAAYPEAEFNVVTPQNYLDWIL